MERVQALGTPRPTVLIILGISGHDCTSNELERVQARGTPMGGRAMTCRMAVNRPGQKAFCPGQIRVIRAIRRSHVWNLGCASEQKCRI